MKRRIAVLITRIFCAALLFSCFFTVPRAAEEQTDSDYVYIAGGESVVITKYTGAGGEVTVPGQMDGKPVTGILAEAFQDNTALTGLVLPDTLETIGQGAFAGCTSLRSLTLPFPGTEKARPGQLSQLFVRMTDSTYPNPLPQSLKTVILCGGGEELPSRAFYGCSSLTKIALAPETKVIGAYAFDYCTNLNEIVLPDHLEEIQEGAFRGCFQLSKIAIPAGVFVIGQSVFENCEALKKIEVHEDNKALLFEGGALYNRGRTHLFLHLPVVSETAYALPDTVASIDPHAFSMATGLGYITTENNPFFTARDGILYNKEQTALLICPRGKSTSRVVVPDSVKTIGKRAFARNSLIVMVVLPEGLEIIEERAFDSCIRLQEIVLPESLIFLGDLCFSQCNSLRTIRIPGGIATLPSLLFSACKNLQQVILSDGVKKIGVGAFMSCQNLTDVVLPETLDSIGNNAFSRCGALQELVLPDRVEEIGYGVFSFCTNLVRITVPRSLVTFGRDVFDETNPMLTLYGDQGSAAETYARENGILFEYRSVEPTEVTGSLRLKIEKQEGETVLTAIRDIDPDHAEMTYRWLADGEVVAETKTNTYTLREEDFGRTFSVQAEGIAPYRGTVSGSSLQTLKKARAAEIVKLPVKREYDIQERWKPYGMVLEITYSDGSTERVEDGFAAGAFDSGAEGKKTVEVRYGEVGVALELFVRCRHSGGIERGLCRVCGRQADPISVRNERAAAFLRVGKAQRVPPPFFLFLSHLMSHKQSFPHIA